MDQVLQYLNRSPGGAVLVLSIVCMILTGACLALSLTLRSQKRKWASLMTGASGDNLEDLLRRHFEDRTSIEDRMNDSEERVATLERKMRTAKRYAGLVRYDAFDDVGGSQSFAFALYDEEGNGAVITSQVGREGCRVYGKTLIGGKSERHLSKEEEMAIDEASAKRSRPRISP